MQQSFPLKIIHILPGPPQEPVILRPRNRPPN